MRCPTRSSSRCKEAAAPKHVEAAAELTAEAHPSPNCRTRKDSICRKKAAAPKPNEAAAKHPAEAHASLSRRTDTAKPKAVETAAELLSRHKDAAAPRSAEAAEDAKEHASEDDQVSSAPHARRANRPPNRRRRGRRINPPSWPSSQAWPHPRSPS